MDPQSLRREDEIKWGSLEKHRVRERILELTDGQVRMLLEFSGLVTTGGDIAALLQEIRQFEHDSLHLDLLLTQWESKRELLEQISMFEA